MGNRSMRFIIISIFTLFLSTSCDFDVKKAQNGTHEENSFNEIEKIHEVIISAQQGNNGASYNLGQYYIQNLGVTRNYQKAIKWLTQAVEAGNPQAQTTLEFLYFGGIPKNILDTEKIYNAAHRGDPIAQNSIGFLVLLQNSRLGLSNEYEAYDWFNKSAKQGNTYAQNNLALLYINSSRIKVDKNRAHDLLLKAAEQGNSAAQHNLGFIYLHGIGVEQNYGQAASWFAAAADQDDAEAQIALGKLYSQGLGVEKNLTKAFECFSKAAPQRYIEAQNNIGNSYLHGLGIKKDSAKALYWYTLSANQGDIWAQKKLSYLYATGIGMPQNFQKAVDWMHKADKQGKIIQDDPTYLHIKKIEKNKDDEEMVTILMQADATNPIVQYALAYSYCNGRGVKRDYSKAIKLYTLSANQGYTDAQKNLSYLYFHGIGTKKNTQLGVKFLQKSAKKK